MDHIISKHVSEDEIVVKTTKLSYKDPSYQLSCKALKLLADYKPLNDEVLNAYMNLISSKRSTNVYNKARFHLFDSLFYFKLS